MPPFDLDEELEEEIRTEYEQYDRKRREEESFPFQIESEYED